MSDIPENIPGGDTPRLLRLATAASVATAIVLIAVKLVAWIMTGSVSLLASLIDSMMDAVASVINFIAVRFALTPADAEHRFGHGKAEALAGLGQAAFIAGSAVFVLLAAVDRLINPAALASVELGIGVTLLAIVLTSGLVVFQRYVIRRTGSAAIRADSLHYLGDLLAYVAVIAALALSQLGWTGADSLFAIAIALFILYAAWQIGRSAVDTLMDRALPTEVEATIRGLALDHERVRGVHELRTRQSGLAYFIQMHLDLDETLSLRDAHAIAEAVENRILDAFPGADVIIHQDPVSIQGRRAQRTARAQPKPFQP